MITTKNKFYSEIKRFGLIFIPCNWLICLIVTIVLFIAVKDNSYAFGYLLGSITSYLTFGLHMKYANDYGSPKANLVMKLFTNFGVRMVIWAVILFIAYKFDTTFRFLTTAIGLGVNVFLIFFGIVYFIVEDKKKKKERSDLDSEDSDGISRTA